MREVSDAFLGLVGALDVHTGIGVGDRGILGGVVGHGAQSITVLGEAAGYPLTGRNGSAVVIVARSAEQHSAASNESLRGSVPSIRLIGIHCGRRYCVM